CGSAGAAKPDAYSTHGEYQRQTNIQSANANGHPRLQNLAPLMKWRTTWMLVGFAATLFAFIVLVEQQLHPPSIQDNAPSRLFSFRAEDVTNVALRVTNELKLRVERNASE